MEPRRETNKQATAAKPAASKQPQSAAAASPNEGANKPKEQTGDQGLLQHAKDATGEVVNQVQQRAGSQIDRGKETAANQLSQVVDAVRRVGETLGGETNGPIVRYAADYTGKAADNLERLSNYIREQDPKQLLNDVQNFGRRQPALLIGGAFLLGFAGARLIKSSMEAASQSATNRGYRQQYNKNVPPLSRNVPATKPPTPQPPSANRI